MHYSLPNGKIVEIPAIFFLQMDDLEFEKEIENLMALDMGFEQNDPFEDSVLRNGEIKKKAEQNEDSTLPLLDEDFDDFFTSLD